MICGKYQSKNEERCRIRLRYALNLTFIKYNEEAEIKFHFVLLKFHKNSKKLCQTFSNQIVQKLPYY